MFWREAEEMCYVGTPTDDSGASGQKYVRLSSSGDMIYGPYTEVPGGLYSMYVCMKISSIASTNRIATCDVYLKHANGNPEQVARRDLTPSEFPATGAWKIFGIPAVRILEGDYDIELRVRDFVTGLGNLDVDWLMLVPVTMGGSWRDVYVGTAYSVNDQVVSAGSYLSGYFNLPKEAVVNAQFALTLVGESGIQRVRPQFYILSSDGQIRAITSEPKHDWAPASTYMKTLRAWTGPHDGITTPQVWWSIHNNDGDSMTVDFSVRYWLTPSCDV